MSNVIKLFPGSPEAIPGSVRSKFSLVIQDLIVRLGVDFVEPHRIYSRGLTMDVFAMGAWWPELDIISVADKLPPGKFGNHDLVLLHEIVHWTGRYDRLDRPAIALLCCRRASEEYLHTEEMTAQMGMLLLAEALDMHVEAARVALESYSTQFPLADLNKAGIEAKSAMEYILHKSEILEVHKIA